MLTNTALFTTEHTTRYTTAFDVFAVHRCLVASGTRLEGKRAMVQSTVEGLHLPDPKLELASLVVSIAAEGNLWWSPREHIQDLLV